MINLKYILEKHQKWLNDEPGGEKANLEGADLTGAYLEGINLSKANLNKANLSEADLSEADLSEADLSEADLTGAYLGWADLGGANLEGANLTRAYLEWADLGGANLSEANLSEANLSDTNLSDTKIDLPMVCPREGSYTAYKKANNYIVVLNIPEDALRSSATSKKCRASKAKVIRIENIDRSIADIKSVSSKYDHNFVYRVGKIVEVKNFNTNRWNECAPGIHHFMNRKEAVDYLV